MAAISDLVGKVPEGPHLGLITDSSGLAVAIPPGAVMLEIIDPTRPDRVRRLVVKEVKRGRWTFKCGCVNPRCTVEVTFRATETGSH